MIVKGKEEGLEKEMEMVFKMVVGFPAKIELNHLEVMADSEFQLTDSCTRCLNYGKLHSREFLKEKYVLN